MILSIIIGLLLCICPILGYEMMFERIEEGLDTDDFFDLSSLRISRVGRGEYAFNGSIVIKTDLDNTVSISIKTSYSATGSSKFTLLPLKIPPVLACDGFNNQYKKYLMEKLAKTSDFPYIKDDEYYCPMKAGIYNVNMYQFDYKTIPKLNSGYYKLTFYFNSNLDDRKAIWNAYANVVSF